MRVGSMLLAALMAASLANVATAADYKTLRNLKAPPPTEAPALPPGAKPRAVQFARIVFQPQDGEAWAIAYTSIMVRAEGDTTPAYRMVPWSGGRLDAATASFGRAFDEELEKAGFKAEARDSLFDTPDGAADLKIGVLIDDIKGRYCVDCPNLFNPHGIPSTVLMTAHWEVFSTLDQKVIAKVTTSGGADDLHKLNGASIVPGILAAFRENVRQLLASDEFRRAVTTPIGGAAASSSTPSAAPQGLSQISLTGPKVRVPLSQASRSVAEVFAADGMGSGFLVSTDGYVLTNRHVVGGSKYVKLKWSNGDEGLGEVMRSDTRRDVALIKTDARGRAPLPLRTGKVEQGEPVFAIGTPLGDESLLNTMTRGIVSAERMEHGLRFIQSDAAVTHGNSGGPLLDEKGAVVGMTVSGLEPNGAPLSLNFFIPIDDALKSLGLAPAS
jgi:S1-C subfamily serine protease